MIARRQAVRQLPQWLLRNIADVARYREQITRPRALRWPPSGELVAIETYMADVPGSVIALRQNANDAMPVGAARCLSMSQHVMAVRVVGLSVGGSGNYFVSQGGAHVLVESARSPQSW